MISTPRSAYPVLIVDDEPQIQASFSLMLRSMGFKNVVATGDGAEAARLIESRGVSLLLLDLSMPNISGKALLPEITGRFPHLIVIVITAESGAESAVQCMKAGAFDYLVKPVEKEQFEASVRRAMDMSMLRTEVSSLKKRLLQGELEHEEAFAGIVTISRGLRAVFQYAEVVAPSDQPVLITGETGVGKELVAKAVHDVSGRKGAFIAVNVAGLDDAMFSDTLFGHRKGAYTGAEDTRDGLCVKAANGTLFLDEIGDANEASQVKLLRLLQDRKYYQLGSDVPRESNARIIVATNRSLTELMSKGAFRSDLYYRLSAHNIHIPPLRERPDDMAILLSHFLDEASRSMKKKRPNAPSELVTLLKTYDFPGNVRELRAMVYDAVARNRGTALSMDSFKGVMGQRKETKGLCLHPDGLKKDRVFDSIDSPEDLPTLKEAEDRLIEKALEYASGNQGIAAMMLGITRQALNKRLSRKRCLPHGQLNNPFVPRNR